MKVCRCCRQSWPIEFYTVCRPDGLRRGKCRACRTNCGPGTSAHKARRHRAAVRAGRVQSLVCAACGLTFGRPMALGRPPERCPSCRNQKRPARVPRPLRQIIVLGPCPCQGCGLPLTWNGWAWEGQDGIRHVCAVAA